MAKRVPGWLLGCGVAGIVVVLFAAALVVGSVLVFRDAIGDFETADAKMETVAERFGPVVAYCPESSGAIPAERLERFLAAREGMAGAREEMDRSLAALSAGDSGGILRKVSAGAGLLHQLARFVDRRSEVLLEEEIGLGEYYYIYSVAYFSWLGKSPADGPSFKLIGDDGYILEKAFEGTTEAEVRRYRREMTRQSLNRLLLPVLRNQRSALDEAGDGVALASWRDALSEEIAKLEAQPERLPWEDGLPQVIEFSLRPYRERLEASYSALCNELEVGVARR